MFNKQSRANIKQLDLRISELSKEIEEMGTHNVYERKLDTLDDLTRLRKQLVEGVEDDYRSNAVIELDRQIEELLGDIKGLEREESYQSKLQRLDDLSKIRSQLAESRVKGSHASTVISGALGITAILLVLNYEKTDVVTSKGFNIATNLFRGI